MSQHRVADDLLGNDGVFAMQQGKDLAARVALESGEASGNDVDVVEQAWRSRHISFRSSSSQSHGQLALPPVAQGAKNVVVMVTRWFGGIHLGPDRFKHINNAARGVLEQGDFLPVKGKKTGKK
mmetsp:Transcript_39437/g.88269  ORF Transcript_39437/g.88269 Transcript_39437/m.88269 type:complete len:124 (-) Transcript_39437:78-449(-)